MNPIILASQSPRRKQLLEWAEVPFEIIVKDTSEDFPPGMKPEEVAVHIARNKAMAVQHDVPGDKVVMAADTIVVLGDNIIGKPVHREDAVSILLALSGEKHRVITGVVIRKGDDEISFADVTEVAFHHLTIEQIEFYVDKYKPY
ncbi:MAG TPA: Maf family protein, partial [Chitinophagaceae bacterium]|nr:Maf family protein [Chitinophagaceae bacterium]